MVFALLKNCVEYDILHNPQNGVLTQVQNRDKVRGIIESNAAKAAAVVCAVLMAHAVFASARDRLLSFSSYGPDRYADGSLVVDGECYALVWSPAGTSFSGFNADGTPVSADDRVILAAPFAEGGKCRECAFQVPDAEYKELKGGEWAVCLVDTRSIYGDPLGAKDGRPLRVNSWGIVKSGVKIDASASGGESQIASLKGAAASGNRNQSGASPARANRRVKVPNSAKKPRITAMDFTGGVVRLTVADTEPYLTYTISSGDTPADLAEDYAAEVVDGVSNSQVEIAAPKTATRRFFKIIRVE